MTSLSLHWCHKAYTNITNTSANLVIQSGYLFTPPRLTVTTQVDGADGPGKC